MAKRRTWRNAPRTEPVQEVGELRKELDKREYTPRVRSSAGDCVMCKALLERIGRKQDTGIRSVHGQVRYCICFNCGHTWKRGSDAEPRVPTDLTRPIEHA